jgi:hypothetical protein
VCRDVRQPAPDQVEGGEQVIGHARVEGETTAAYRVQQVLGGMGEPGQLGEAEQARRALERVRGPEHLVGQFGVAGHPLQLKESVADPGEQVVRLGEELGEQRIHSAPSFPAIVSPAAVSMVATRTSRSPVTGLTR